MAWTYAYEGTRAVLSFVNNDGQIIARIFESDNKFKLSVEPIGIEQDGLNSETEARRLFENEIIPMLPKYIEYKPSGT